MQRPLTGEPGKKKGIVTMKKIIALALSVMLLALCFAGCGVKKETIVVGYTIYAPMNYLDDNGELIAYYEKHEYRDRETMEPYDMKKFFESDYARCEYNEEDNVVFHIWKKEAHYADYRNPVIASLEMLKKHEDSIFIVDARNGFEDVPEDVDWGFQWFLPELKQTGCKIWGFILPEVSDIEGEIDLWTKEIEKNFTVIRAVSYDEIVKAAKEL